MKEYINPNEVPDILELCSKCVIVEYYETFIDNPWNEPAINYHNSNTVEGWKIGRLLGVEAEGDGKLQFRIKVDKGGIRCFSKIRIDE